MKPFTTALLAFFVLLGLASPAQAALPAWPNVKIGATGPTVQSAQHLLRHRGYNIAADGDFGPATESAVKQFQTSAGLRADGEVGPLTWPKLIVSVQRGNNSEAVKAAQIQLNRYGYGLVVDGDFGGGTYNAAVAFQTAQQLENNGIIGPMTWQALVGGTPGGSGAFSLPLARGDLPRSEYDDPHHDYPAIDLPVSNRPAYAMVSGVAYRINDGATTGCGYGVKILKDGVEYQYCHFSSWAVANGQSVTAGQQVGTTGNTGNSTGPHLHIAIKINGVKRCPQNFLLAIYDGLTPPVPSSLPTTGCYY
ncbi:Peptidoglycan-binding (PGRP) domain of peptidoglycan hydrolases-containing protein [Lentzea albidocapillata subsp. violacea]|uniref:Peptidoglycan-binding (PGRP) domain of peptidoglycan hydrolases-containing protein n=1 Tax=Lentzea albidocapillata subsp. violacea TaxID=128104 RepID=A0A1G8QDX9_9PSEU|nr:peptidoglycan-binding protein [Lentzea albidocapillata]SDJ02655.1 Peptidoglycan-binding (PGRP) domain of peptidoglycan hydrolases-containing protein [Lentzea albidocapillata subsp. violacea]